MLNQLHAYKMELPIQLANDLEDLADVLQISRGEVMGRAILLLHHAVNADRIILTKDGKQTTVKVK